MKQTKKVGSRFWKGYAIIVSLLLLLVAAGLGVFYDFIHAYERSQPENTAEEFVQSFKEELLFQWITDASDSLTLSYETRETAVQALRQTVSSLEGEYSCQREYGISADTPVFRLYRGDTWIGRFTLTDTQEGKYGFSSWVVDTGEAILDSWSAGTITHTVYAPADADVYVNGVSIRPEDCISASVPYPYLHSLDKKDAVSVCLYSIAGLYTEPDITCVLEEENCAGETSEGVTRFRIPDSQTNSYTFQVPHKSELFVNGKSVPEDYRTEIQRAYSYSVLEAGANDLPTEDVYVIRGLMTKPEVLVRYDSMELDISEMEDVFCAEYPASRMYNSSVLVPAGSELTVRGISCEAFSTGETAAAYPELYADSAFSPVYEIYRFDSLFLPLTDVSVCHNGELLPFIEQNDSYTQYIEAQYPACDNADIRSLALTFAKDYVQYVAYGYSNTSVNLANALQHVQQGSELYSRIQRSKIGIDFVTPVTSQSYNKLEITEMRQLSENNVYCRIAFDIDQYIYRVHRSYAGTMELNCSWNGDRWVIDEMRITTDN